MSHTLTTIHRAPGIGLCPELGCPWWQGPSRALLHLLPLSLSFGCLGPHPQGWGTLSREHLSRG